MICSLSSIRFVLFCRQAVPARLSWKNQSVVSGPALLYLSLIWKVPCPRPIGISQGSCIAYQRWRCGHLVCLVISLPNILCRVLLPYWDLILAVLWHKIQAHRMCCLVPRTNLGGLVGNGPEHIDASLSHMISIVRSTWGTKPAPKWPSKQRSLWFDHLIAST